jgi:hypothetical protein
MESFIAASFLAVAVMTAFRPFLYATSLKKVVRGCSFLFSMQLENDVL